MALHSLILLLLLLLLLVTTAQSHSSSSPPEDADIVGAEVDMQGANYYTFVTLMNMVRDQIPRNTTFLVPDDHVLSNAVVSSGDVLNFLFRHSIPSPLRFNVLRRLPTSSMLPTNLRGMSLTVTNNGDGDFRLNTVRIVNPDVCVAPGSIACHGIDGILIVGDAAPPSGRNGSDYCSAPAPDAELHAVAPAPSANSGGGSVVVVRRGWLGAVAMFASLSAAGLVW